MKQATPMNARLTHNTLLTSASMRTLGLLDGSRDHLLPQLAQGEQNMSLLMTTTFVLGTFASPAPEADFQVRFQQAVRDLGAPVLALEDKVVDGRVNGIAEEESQFVVIDEAGKSYTFTWNDNTEWLLNGEKVTRKEALADGRNVSVKSENGQLAARVSVTTE